MVAAVEMAVTTLQAEENMKNYRLEEVLDTPEAHVLWASH
jgi:hypothetical protein